MGSGEMWMLMVWYGMVSIKQQTFANVNVIPAHVTEARQKKKKKKTSHQKKATKQKQTTMYENGNGVWVAT